MEKETEQDSTRETIELVPEWGTGIKAGGARVRARLVAAAFT